MTDLRGNGTPSILVVGFHQSRFEEVRAIYPGADMSFVGLEELVDITLAKIDPDIIVSPVVSRSFDCIELAQRLHAMSYRNAYHAVATNIPQPKMISAEVHQLCPGLDFKIVSPPTVHG